jgi:hypothetical protein
VSGRGRIAKARLIDALPIRLLPVNFSEPVIHSAGAPEAEPWLIQVMQGSNENGGIVQQRGQIKGESAGGGGFAEEEEDRSWIGADHLPKLGADRPGQRSQGSGPRRQPEQLRGGCAESRGQTAPSVGRSGTVTARVVGGNLHLSPPSGGMKDER